MILLHCVGIFKGNTVQGFNGFIFSDLAIVIEKLLVHFSSSGNNPDTKKKFQLVSVKKLM